MQAASNGSHMNDTFLVIKKKKKLDLKHALWKMCEPFCVETGIFAIQISKPHKKLKDVGFFVLANYYVQ